MAFHIFPFNLVAGDGNGWQDVFLHDRFPVGLTSIAPREGPDVGGDLIHLFGHGLATGCHPIVQIGGASATLVTVMASRLAVRTPVSNGSTILESSDGGQTRPNSACMESPAGHGIEFVRIVQRGDERVRRLRRGERRPAQRTLVLLPSLVG